VAWVFTHPGRRKNGLWHLLRALRLQMMGTPHDAACHARLFRQWEKLPAPLVDGRLLSAAGEGRLLLPGERLLKDGFARMLEEFLRQKVKIS
jgi:hypothetical protein